MRLLLDTHAVLWWFNGDRALSHAARTAIESGDNQIFVSAVSAMEVSTKHRIGKLPRAGTLANRFAEMVEQEAFIPLPVTLAHGVLGGRLPIDHKDPFDRLLVAQALLESLTLVSNERTFDTSGVVRLW